MQETWVQSLEEGMASHSSILAWRIPWTEEPGGLQSMGHKELDGTEHSFTDGFLHYPGVELAGPKVLCFFFSFTINVLSSGHVTDG